MNNPKKRMNTLSICTSLTQCDESTEEQGGFVVVTPKKKDALEMLPDIEGGTAIPKGEPPVPRSSSHHT